MEELKEIGKIRTIVAEMIPKGKFCAQIPSLLNISSKQSSCRFGWSKKKVPISRSGRVIKGRGVFVSEKIDLRPIE